MILMLCLSLFLITSYLGITVFKYGIPKSISESYYLYNKKSYFTIVMFLCGLLSAPYLIENLNTTNYQFISFLIVASIIFVGASPAFKDGLDRKVHKISAYIFILFSEVFIYLNNGLLIELILSFICLYFILKEKHKIIFWIEIIVLYTLYFTCFKNLI